MAIIKKPCKFCDKVTDITSEIDLGASGRLIVRSCGHSYIEERLDSKVKEETTSETTLSLFEQLEQAIPEDCEEHGRKCIKTFTTKNGSHLFPYQRDGIVKAYKNNAKFIWNDEMGLGKTIQALGTIKCNPEKLLPAIFVCKSIAKTNMLWEVMNVLEIPAQVIDSSSDTPWDMFKVHIISYDLMNRIDKLFHFSDMKLQVECPECHYRCDEDKHNIGEKCPSCSQTKHAVGDISTRTIKEDGKIVTFITNTQVTERKEEIPLLIQFIDKTLSNTNNLKDQNKLAWTKIIQRCQTIILDEVHLLKNPETQRSKALKAVSSMIPHPLCLSGTLIKNNATEYFVPLNIIKPERYWRFNSFCMNNVRQDFVRSVTGQYVKKWTGLINPERFLDNNSDCMIRRTTDEVLPQLPKLWKQQKYVELEENFREVYDESEKDFAQWFDTSSAAEIRMNLLAQLAKLRHQTSLAKIDFTIDLALSFIMENDRKIAIFTHHIDSREFLADRMIKFFHDTNHDKEGPIVRVLGQNPKGVQEEIAEFKNSPTEKIIILSTLSHGESINLQFMHDSILHERQWNPANEDQAISGRFRRIGQEAQGITCMIPCALGTIDEYYVEINKRKENISKELDNGIVAGEAIDFVAELAQKIAEKGRAKWRL